MSATQNQLVQRGSLRVRFSSFSSLNSFMTFLRQSLQKLLLSNLGQEMNTSDWDIINYSCISTYKIHKSKFLLGSNFPIWFYLFSNKTRAPLSSCIFPSNHHLITDSTFPLIVTEIKKNCAH